MITDFDRNVRTLIVSFVVAIMAMIPLRFVEIGEQLVSLPNTMVLGESTEVVLPATPVIEETAAPILEAPYDEIDGPAIGLTTDRSASEEQVLGVSTENEQVLGAETECVSAADAAQMIEGISTQITRGGLSGGEMQRMLDQVLAIQNNICR